MTTKQLLKCYGDYCDTHNKKYPKEELEYIVSEKGAKKTGKNYCKKCAPLKKREELDLMELKIFLRDYFIEGEAPTKAVAQIKQIRREYGISIPDINKTLLYFTEVKKEKLTQQSIGIVPFIYEEMLEYIKKETLKREQLKDIEEAVKPIILKVKPPKRKFDYQQTKLIDMEALANGSKNKTKRR